MTSKLESRLRKFHIDIPKDKPQDWLPRGANTIARSLDTGLRDITNYPEYDRWGFPKEHPPPCRWCGNKNTYWVQETNMAFIYGCPTENCPNNQDSKSHEYLIANRSQKRRIGTIKEDQFGEEDFEYDNG